jgi:hypothetical protein
LGGNTTPLGAFDIVRKIGAGLPEFAVLSSESVSGGVATPVLTGGDPPFANAYLAGNVRAAPGWLSMAVDGGAEG